MLLSRINWLKTKESQPQAEVRRHSMSLGILAQPSPTVSQLLSPGPSHRPSFPTSTPGTVFWAFKTPPAWAQWPRSAPPVPPTTPLPSGPVLPGWPSHQLQSQPTLAATFWHYWMNHLIVLHNWLWNGIPKNPTSVGISPRAHQDWGSHSNDRVCEDMRTKITLVSFSYLTYIVLYELEYM